MTYHYIRRSEHRPQVERQFCEDDKFRWVKSGRRGAVGINYRKRLAATATGAVIGGGAGNSASGAYSSILGGSANTDSGFANIGMYGIGLVGASVPGPSSFWVDELVSPNIPAGNSTTCAPPGGYPIGSLYYVIPTGTTYKQVFVV